MKLSKEKEVKKKKELDDKAHGEVMRHTVIERLSSKWSTWRIK